MMSTIMPAIVRDIGGITLNGWTFAIYEIDSIIAGAAAGRLARPAGAKVATPAGGDEPWDAADWRVYSDERAAIAEYDGGLPRPEAEAWAWDCCVIEWLNQHAVRSDAGWCQACRGPYGTETTGHVWLHAECWLSWHAGRRDEAEAALKAMGVGTGTS
jgi:hypothetical protein